MKKLFFLLVAGNLCFAQNVAFGDENFKKTLIKTYSTLDANKDGEISFDEAKTLTAIRNLSLYNFIKIKSVVGIEAFENITELDLKQNQITSIDLSKNLKIKTLNLRENLIEGELDLSMLTEATSVELNTNKITSLKLPSAGKIQFLYANDNLLTSVDLSGQPDLKRPFFVRNAISSISFSNNPNIDRIHLDGNKLASVDLSGLTKLAWVSLVENNLSQMTFSNNPLLRTLLLQKNNLTQLNFQDGFANSLTLINLTDNATFSKILKDCNDAVSGVNPSSTLIDSNCSLSVNEIDKNENKVFPNPFVEQLSFADAVTNIEVFEASGRKVFSKNSPSKSIALGFLKSGQYIVTYYFNGKKVSKVILKK